MRYVLMFLMAGVLAAGCGDDGAAEGAEGAEGAGGGDNANADTSMPGDPVAGEAVYTTSCVACHGADGRGNGGIGGDFIGEPERLAQDNAVLLAKIADGITGNRVMPPHRDSLTEQQRKDSLSYIRQQWGGE
ncbi:MAG: cytochrome c [Deltaproteobacteria bacterium]|nr:cytochrome c [Deltaproteobacteria bacterium]